MLRWLLLRRSAVERLLGEDDVLLWAVTLVEPGSVWSVDWSAYCVLDAGAVYVLPCPGPPTGRRAPVSPWPRRGVGDWASRQGD
ncbi:hypothetical protein [Streptomyces sp. NRRL S-350]|uniref:hypothetical protein n=1 Tax=Streptomyces sp. NRRL S-350 TaxID=1463902 RepID=UPI0004C2844F|nr:hypothetical protein [Streptomyces sp. NRRL S-350]